ncbi:MAG: GGDEF domain-containing protein [Actinomycetota bacterium]|nr:GGDEF domain-containing protein [Actinomycetota bacterium]
MGRRALTSARVRRAAMAVVEEAHERIPELTWVVARGSGEKLTVLCRAGEDDAVAEGDRIRPDAATDLVVPLELPDGSAFGAVCGLGVAARAQGPLPVAQILRLADLLAAVLGAEWEIEQHAYRAESEARRAVQAEGEALTDPLTGVANRRAWDRAVEAEERRLRRYGGQAGIIVVDVDDLRVVNNSQGHLGGDLLLRLVAGTLVATSRESDTVARTGGDEFAVLALDCDEAHLSVLLDRFRRALDEQGAPASVGGVCWRPSAAIEQVFAEADEVMYAEKARRKR